MEKRLLAIGLALVSFGAIWFFLRTPAPAPPEMPKGAPASPTPAPALAAVDAGAIVPPRVASATADAGGTPLPASSVTGCTNPTDVSPTVCRLPVSTPMAVPLAAAAAAVSGSYVYIAGGSVNVNGTEGSRLVYFSRLDAKGVPGKWSTTTPIDQAVMQSAMVAHDGVVYLLGGAIPGAEENYPVASVSFARVQADGTLGRWTSGPSLPTPEAGLAAAISNGFLYAIGGYEKAGGGTTSSGSVYAAAIHKDGTLGSWKTTSALPGARFFLSGGAAAGFLYAVGGFYDTGVTKGKFKTGKIECEATRVVMARQNKDGTLSPWQPVLPFAAEAVAPAVAVLDGMLIVAGGYSHRTPGGSVAVLGARIQKDGTLQQWSVLGWLPEAATTRAFAASDSALYLFGGTATEDQKVFLTPAADVVPVHGGKVLCPGP